jgi:hypothetical protein
MSNCRSAMPPPQLLSLPPAGQARHSAY